MACLHCILPVLDLAIQLNPITPHSHTHRFCSFLLSLRATTCTPQLVFLASTCLPTVLMPSCVPYDRFQKNTPDDAGPVIPTELDTILSSCPVYVVHGGPAAVSTPVMSPNVPPSHSTLRVPINAKRTRAETRTEGESLPELGGRKHLGGWFGCVPILTINEARMGHHRPSMELTCRCPVGWRIGVKVTELSVFMMAITRHIVVSCSRTLRDDPASRQTQVQKRCVGPHTGPQDLEENNKPPAPYPPHPLACPG
jgi:hypothetical protein